LQPVEVGVDLGVGEQRAPPGGGLRRDVERRQAIAGSVGVEMEQGDAGQVRRECGRMLIGPVPVRNVLEKDKYLLERVRVARQAARLELLPAVSRADGSPGMVNAQLAEQADQPSRRVEARLVRPLCPVRGTREGLDDREGQRHGAARAGLLGRAC